MVFSVRHLAAYAARSPGLGSIHGQGTSAPAEHRRGREAALRYPRRPVVTIKDERRAIAAELGQVLGVATDEADHAIQAEDARHLPHKRNLVSVLASTAELAAMLRAMPDADRKVWLGGRDVDGRTRRELALGGEIAAAGGELSDHLAGPYDVAWDGNWPSAAPRLRGTIPIGTRPDDVIVGGDGGGVRTQLRVIRDTDGVLTAEVIPDTWRDPPFEEVWLDTYRRLEELYPEEVPPVA